MEKSFMSWTLLPAKVVGDAVEKFRVYILLKKRKVILSISFCFQGERFGYNLVLFQQVG